MSTEKITENKTILIRVNKLLYGAIKKHAPNQSLSRTVRRAAAKECRDELAELLLKQYIRDNPIRTNQKQVLAINREGNFAFINQKEFDVVDLADKFFVISKEKLEDYKPVLEEQFDEIIDFIQLY